MFLPPPCADRHPALLLRPLPDASQVEMIPISLTRHLGAATLALLLAHRIKLSLPFEAPAIHFHRRLSLFSMCYHSPSSPLGWRDGYREGLLSQTVVLLPTWV